MVQALLQGSTTLSPDFASLVNTRPIVRAAREEDLHTCQVENHDHAAERDLTQFPDTVTFDDLGH